MSNTKKAGRDRAVKTGDGPRVPLVCDIPGGQAHWYAPAELTPRRTQDYELIAAEMAPTIQAAVDARAVTVDGQTTTFDGFTGPTARLSRADLRALVEMTEAATWAFLKSWTLTDPAGAPLPLPVDADALRDLSRPLYEALNRHGAKLMAALDAPSQFTVEALGDLDDPGEADPDLPTSA